MNPDPDPSYDFSDELEFFFKYSAVGPARRHRRPGLPAAGLSARLTTYSAFSSSATAVTDFFASPNSMVVPSP